MLSMSRWLPTGLAMVGLVVAGVAQAGSPIYQMCNLMIQDAQRDGVISDVERKSIVSKAEKYLEADEIAQIKASLAQAARGEVKPVNYEAGRVQPAFEGPELEPVEVKKAEAKPAKAEEAKVEPAEVASAEIKSVSAAPEALHVPQTAKTHVVAKDSSRTIHIHLHGATPSYAPPCAAPAPTCCESSCDSCKARSGKSHGCKLLGCLGRKHSSCDTCASSCETKSCFSHCKHLSGKGCIWTAGAEATYLQPDLRGPNFIALGGGEVDSTIFDQEYSAAPRMWVGAETCHGWGIRGRYWDLDSSAQVQEVLMGGDLLVTGGSDVEAYTVDLELTKRFATPHCMLLLTAGGRHAELELQDSLVGLTFDGDMQLGALGRRVEGTGVTTSAELAKSLGGGVSLVVNARYSYLWGDARASGANSEFDPTFAESATVNEEMWILEGQAGVEVVRYLDWCRSVVTVRAVFEYQRWRADDNLQATAAAFPVLVSNQSSDLDFYGPAFSVAISR